MAARFAGRVFHLDRDMRHRRLVGRQDNIVKIHIAVGAAQVLHLEADNLNALDKTLAVSVEGIEGIYSIVFGAMSRGVVQHEQRIEFLEGCLGSGSLHLLRLVHNDNWAVSGNHVDRTA